MPDARRLARLQRALAFAVVAAALLALAIAADGLAFHLRAAVADVTAGSAPSAAGLLILALVAAEVVLATTAVLAGIRRVRAQRRFLGTLHACGEDEVHGVPVVLVADPRPLVFCAGLLRPRVYLSVGARRRLAPRALRAVLAHEAHHARRRDPLRLLVAGTLGRLPCLAGFARRQEVLTDLAADAAAVRAVHGPGPLAAAMLALSEFRVAPERVDQLRGAGVDFRVPGAWLAGALAVFAASVASALQQLAEPGAPHVCIAEPTGAALVVAGAAALARRARR